MYKTPIVGKCPICHSQMYATNNDMYICDNGDFRITRIVWKNIWHKIDIRIKNSSGHNSQKFYKRQWGTKLLKELLYNNDRKI